MSSDEFRRTFTGEVPEPPDGSPQLVARLAWKMAWRAEQIAIGADNRSLALFENLGAMATTFTEEMLRRFDKVDEEMEKVTRRLDELNPKVKSAEENAADARTSSHDLEKEVEKMETILADIKSKAVDSIRIKQLVVEEHQVLVTKGRLEELEKREKEAEEERKARAAESRSYKLTTRSGIVVGVIVMLIGMFATYAFTKATNPPPATLQAPSH